MSSACNRGSPLRQRVATGTTFSFAFDGSCTLAVAVAVAVAVAAVFLLWLLVPKVSPQDRLLAARLSSSMHPNVHELSHRCGPCRRRCGSGRRR